MLITFTTDAYGDITMFGDAGLSMIKMMGHSESVPGAILAEDVPAAMNKLIAAVEAAETPPPAKDEGEDEDEEAEEAVSIANRALPLIELLASAVREKSDVMWK